MSSSRLGWILLNVVGGTAVLGSYLWGFRARPDAMGALWGGVPESLRPVYTTNMFLAAAGYFLFGAFVLRLPPERTRVGERLGYGVFAVLYALILFPSALWLPLVVAYVDAPSAWLWLLIRVDLLLVGIGSVGLLWAVLAVREPARPPGRALAVIGLVPFILQTAVLDALVWPAYFPTP